MNKEIHTIHFCGKHQKEFYDENLSSFPMNSYLLSKTVTYVLRSQLLILKCRLWHLFMWYIYKKGTKNRQRKEIIMLTDTCQMLVKQVLMTSTTD